MLLPYAMPDRGLVPAAHSLSTITQSQIAAAGGTVKEVAARAIAELEARKALRREHGHIRYLDREVLLGLIEDVRKPEFVEAGKRPQRSGIVTEPSAS